MTLAVCGRKKDRTGQSLQHFCVFAFENPDPGLGQGELRLVLCTVSARGDGNAAPISRPQRRWVPLRVHRGPRGPAHA